ncbi:hypothetical protein ASJ81_13610 [Methanosarcina spelaei]|uniref:Uncharacterized protein n=1 Tax=Methanosarcina spelaei TaxID=1036679 RepID=A0A2A2HYI1_9EURY|nr:hypothetical protein ASJ81_13610 [Methanosarcina spelaei]
MNSGTFSQNNIVIQKQSEALFSWYLLEISSLALKDFLTYIRDEKRYASSTVENFFASLSSFFRLLRMGRSTKNITYIRQVDIRNLNIFSDIVFEHLINTH